jgi:hypothetical protein
VHELNQIDSPQIGISKVFFHVVRGAATVAQPYLTIVILQGIGFKYSLVGIGTIPVQPAP